MPIDQDHSPALSKPRTLISTDRHIARGLEVHDDHGTRIGFLVISSRVLKRTLATFTEYEVTHRE